ncbi:uncharacterized protein PHACADRAFT_183571 [Phanerochaete carnosa HHB-10118-sp]|uniref:Uncharacterized protein n=1 Tax=Phanerochaete carnosa (strain HHB-10118-sp) TaxID=650164 RepID=K5VZM5_PHACS|nr:uncharacterized protein PHACADRAFT_183571 [Phanerochaete carnosa HHB-10118-sp]EKM57033.1 hypothetical protein PHACADRAFT_183571 [Phanerochaete carnosa HHB-10118-sp]
MAMRFHFHELSSSASKGSSLEQQRAANAQNESLAYRFYEVFHEADRTHGICVGGFVKELAIEATRVPIKLDRPNGPTPLERVLQKAYRLLHRHYKRVDQADLDRFAVAPKAGRPSRLVLETGIGKEKDPSHVALYDHDSMNVTPYRVPSSSSRSSPSSVSSKRSHRPLDSHSAMSEILRLAFFDDDGKPLDITDYLGDCLYDQCTNQPVMTSSRRKNFTGVALAHILARSLESKASESNDSGSEVSSQLPTIEEVPEEDRGAEQSSPGSAPPIAGIRVSRTANPPKETLKSKKTTTSRKDSLPQKAKTAAVQKAETSRKSSLPNTEALTSAWKVTSRAKLTATTIKTSAKLKARVVASEVSREREASKAANTAVTADKTSVAAGAVRRSARLATKQEDNALPPPITGKRKRGDEATDAQSVQFRANATRTRKITSTTRDRSGAEPAVTPKPIASKATTARKAKAASEAPARRSTRLAAKKA